MKIVKTAQHFSTVKLILGILISSCGLTSAANAQPLFVGKVTLPYEVRWNHAVLPAGEYLIRMDSKGAPALLHSMSTGKSTYTAVPIIAAAQKGSDFVTVTMRGKERRVRSLNLPEIGQSLIFEPLTKTEREMLATAGQIDTVPVVTARK
jgi:hypothetical protein